MVFKPLQNSTRYNVVPFYDLYHRRCTAQLGDRVEFNILSARGGVGYVPFSQATKRGGDMPIYGKVILAETLKRGYLIAFDDGVINGHSGDDPDGSHNKWWI